MSPELCQRCLFGCPWNGRFGCSHESHMAAIDTPEPPCKGQHFKVAKVWTWPPKPAEDAQ